MRHLTVHQCIFEGQVIASVNQQLILQMLRWMEVFAGRFFPIATSLFPGTVSQRTRTPSPHLNRVVAGDYASVLHLDTGRRVGELALCVRTRTFVPLEFATSVTRGAEWRQSERSGLTLRAGASGSLSCSR